MLRKFFLLILFVMFICMVGGLLSSQGGLRFSNTANPSQKPLPKAWANQDRMTVRLASDEQEAAPLASLPAANNSACPATVSVQTGDTLGEIAKRCAISLTDLLAANPEITNPNRIYPGQNLFVHGARGGADPSAVNAQPPAGGYLPGAEVVVDAWGFAPDAQVKIGIGLPGSGFHALGVFTAGSDGHLVATLTIPYMARAGERAFFLLTSKGVPTVQRVSDAFVIQN